MTQQGNIVMFDRTINKTPIRPHSHVFKHLTFEDWRAIFDRGELLTYDEGEVILLEGVDNRSLYFIDEGEVRVERNHNGRRVELARLPAGSVFGEMSMLDGNRASASIVADGLVDIVRVERAELDRIMAIDPGLGMRFYHSLAETLAGRLRETNNNVHNA